MNRALSRQSGFTLIEMMIALLILAIGLLGFAGLQTQGIVMGRKAFLHSQAEMLAEDIVERIRANKAKGDFSVTLGYAMAATDVGQDNHCDSNACTPAQMTQWDQYRWQRRVGGSLPAGQGDVDVSVGSNPYATVTVTVHYNLDSDKKDADAYQYKLTTKIY